MLLSIAVRSTFPLQDRSTRNTFPQIHFSLFCLLLSQISGAYHYLLSLAWGITCWSIYWECLWKAFTSVQMSFSKLKRTYPVAFEARAELRESLALTSMMQYSSEVGWSAYWMLHSPTMPRWRTQRIAVSRSMWYSSLERVWLGATTIESPGEKNMIVTGHTKTLNGRWRH